MNSHAPFTSPLTISSNSAWASSECNGCIEGKKRCGNIAIFILGAFCIQLRSSGFPICFKPCLEIRAGRAFSWNRPETQQCEFDRCFYALNILNLIANGYAARAGICAIGFILAGKFKLVRMNLICAKSDASGRWIPVSGVRGGITYANFDAAFDDSGKFDSDSCLVHCREKRISALIIRCRLLGYWIAFLEDSD